MEREQPSPAATAITAALGGDVSWLPCAPEELKITIDIEVTPKIEYALRQDIDVWEWDEQLHPVDFVVQYDCALGKKGEMIKVELPFWYVYQGQVIPKRATFLGPGGPLGCPIGNATLESIKAAGGRILGKC